MAAKQSTQLKAVPAYEGSVGQHYDEMHRTLSHLYAALHTCSAGGHENFSELPPGVQDNYLCMMCDLASSALEHAEHLTPPRRVVADG